MEYRGLHCLPGHSNIQVHIAMSRKTIRFWVSVTERAVRVAESDRRVVHKHVLVELGSNNTLAPFYTN